MTTLKEQIQANGIILPFTGENIVFGKQLTCTLNGETFPVEPREAITNKKGIIIASKEADVLIDTKLAEKLEARREDVR